MALPFTLSILQGVYYQAGTQVPVANRFGERYMLYNHTTGTYAPVDADGLVRLEGRGIYTAELLDLERRLGRQGRARSESNLDESKRTWKTPPIRLGRRTSEQSISPKRIGSVRPPSLGSLNSLRKGSVEGGEDEAKTPKKSVTESEANPITSSFPNLLDSIKSYRRQSSSGSSSTIRRQSMQAMMESTKPDPDTRPTLPPESPSSTSAADLASSHLGPSYRSSSIGSLNKRLSAPAGFGIAPSLDSIAGTLTRGTSGASGTFHSESENEEDHDDPVSLMDFLGPSVLKKSGSMVSEGSGSLPPMSNRASVLSKRSSSMLSDEGASPKASVGKRAPSILTDDAGSPKGSVAKKSYTSSRLGRFSIGVSTSQDSLAEIPQMMEYLKTQKGTSVVSLWFTLRDYVLRAFEDEHEVDTPVIEIDIGGCLGLPDSTLSPFGFNVMYDTENLTPAEAEAYEVRDTTSGDVDEVAVEQKGALESFDGDKVPPLVKGSNGAGRHQRALLKQIKDNLGGSVVIRYEESEAGGMNKLSIAAGTTDKLVEHLADEQPPDMEYIATLLYTHRFFADSVTLLDMLRARLHVEPPDHSSSEQMAYVRKWRHVVRLRAIHVVKVWADTLWSLDFASLDPRSALEEFILAIQKGPVHEEDEDRRMESVFVDDFRRLAVLLRALVLRKEQNVFPPPQHTPNSESFSPSSSPTSPTSATTPDIPVPSSARPRTNFLDLDPKEVAIQLTILEHERLRAIPPVALLLHLNDKGKDPVISAVCKPVREMVEAFNQISYWIATEICTQPELKNRVKVVERCIKIGKRCQKLNNYQTLMAIISGLNVSAVSRLKATWEAVDPKHRKTLEDLESTLSPQHNYRTYRALLEEAQANSQSFKPSPFIPILGLVLKDLLFIDDGNKTTLDNGMVNFSKFRTMYMNVARVCGFQQIGYVGLVGRDVREDDMEKVRDFVRSLRSLKEAALYKYSCLCEAKVGADETLSSKWMKESKR
ncbi:hypothetical protein HDV00_005057 [Rhizophlyctis rosea]|nr:hypothetical protein HDV00_005057 [Rhizophlyctis rosea]